MHSTVGLAPARSTGVLAFVPPAGAAVGSLWAIEVPDSDGQSLLVKLPRGVPPGQPLLVPWEIAANGLVQHPLVPPACDEGPFLVAQGKQLQAPPSNCALFCNARCCCEVVTVLAVVLTLAVVPALLLEQTGEEALAVAGLVLAAVLPSAVLMLYSYCKYRRSLLKMQMFISFVEPILWLVPFAGLVVGLRFAGFFELCDCTRKCDGEGGSCEHHCEQGVPCYLYDALCAYVLAALLEEALKYLCVRRITFASMAVDAMSLCVYGGCAALGFATVENLLYVLAGGVRLAGVRAVLSVPLHMGCGLMIGCGLGMRRFLDQPVPCCGALLGPVLAHGTYDFCLFASVRAGGRYPLLGFALAALVSSLTWLAVRAWVLHLGVVPRADVRALLRQGVVRPPTFLCCTCTWPLRVSPATEANPPSGTGAASPGPPTEPQVLGKESE